MEASNSSTVQHLESAPGISSPGNRKRPRPEKGTNAVMSDDGSKDVPFLIDWPIEEGVAQKVDSQHVQSLKLNAVVTFSSRHTTRNSSQQTENLSLCLMGRAQLRCLQGAVDILGYRLDPSHQGVMQVESPPWSSLLVLKPIHHPTTGVGASSETKDLENLDVILQVDSWWPPSADETHKEATFELAKSPFPGVRPTCIPPTWKHAMDTLLPQAWSKTSVKADNSTIHDSGTGNEENANFRMAICGAKGVGKSTFLRYALNRILAESATAPKSTTPIEAKPQAHQRQQVAILDADVGQPEMSPPGLLTLTVVSEPLLTPPHYRSLAKFPHDHQISYFFGGVTSRNDPHRYMELIQRLVHDYEKHFMPLGIPLLVNLDGWVKGLGYELLCNLLKEIIQPTNVVQIVGLTKSKQFELRGVLNSSSATSHGRTQLHVIYAYNSALNNNIMPPPTCTEAQKVDDHSSAALDCNTGHHTVNNGFRTNGESSFLSAMAINVPVSCTMPAAALRALRLCTYFLDDVSIWYHLGFGHEGIGDDTCEIAHRLAGSLPYAVPFEAVDIEWAGSDHFQDIDNDSSPRNFDLRLDAINAKLVGLCCRPEKLNVGDDLDGSCPREYPLRCVGLGLVRSIDRAREIFYILTPVESDQLKDVNVLVGCTVDLPVEFWFRGAHAEAFPYQSFSTPAASAVGAEPMKSRNNIGRKSLAGN